MFEFDMIFAYWKKRCIAPKQIYETQLLVYQVVYHLIMSFNKIWSSKIYLLNTIIEICHWIIADPLTHWSRVTHICVGSHRGSDNGLSPCLHQCWNIVNWTLQWNHNRNSCISFEKIHLKMSSGKKWSFCLGPNVLNILLQGCLVTTHKWNYVTIL